MDNKWKLALACVGSAVVGGGVVGLVMNETIKKLDSKLENTTKDNSIESIVNNKVMLRTAHITSLDFVKALIDLGTNVDELDASGNTILINCVMDSTMNDGYKKTTLEIATHLVREAKANKDIIGDYRKTALELARRVKNQDMIDLLS